MAPVRANNTPQPPSPPFSQNWSNAALITADDNWSGVPGIVGFLGDYTTASPTGVDPQTLLQDMTTVDVIANQSNPNVSTGAPGGVAEFDGIADRSIALNGSGTADAPNVVFYLNTTGFQNINVAYALRDLDGSVDDAAQQVALQYRVGGSGNFTNIPAGYVNDATTGPSLATKVTPVSVTLPAAANNQPLVQVRVMTTNAAGNDEWVGVDNINITGSPFSNATNPTGTGNANPNTVAAGDTTLLTVAVTPGTNPTSTAHTVSANLTAIGGSAAQQFFDDGSNGDQTAGDNVFSFSATVGNGTSGGTKTLPATITETSPNARTGTASISLTVLAPTNPTATGSANPNSLPAGSSTLLTVNVTPGANPTSSGISVTANLTAIGGSAAQVFTDNGGNSFSFQATVAPGTTPGAKSLPVAVSDAQGRTGSANINLTVEQPVVVVEHLVISQVYGSGGNTGAAYNRDYVELYNPGTQAFDTAGWSLQYASAAGTSWTNRQPLGGVIQPGEYYLVALSQGAVGADLPTQPNISGEINMSGTAGKIALVRNGDPLVGSCPLSDPDLVDFVGYGTTANCSENTNAPAPSASNAIFRKGNGAQDTDNNGADFNAAPANPRRTTPIQEIGPSVLSTDPRTDGFNVPRDASIIVTFTEPVTGDSGWFNINCATTGLHNDATVATVGRDLIVTPNVNFLAGEQCAVTVNKDLVHDEDSDDGTANSDTLAANYTWSFTVATGTAPPYPPEVHLTMGNPTGATADVNLPNNYLMEKPEFALSYNRDRGAPNWVSWHLSDEWTGTLTRVDTFRPDPAVPSDWYRVLHTDYSLSGFDRGHMTPNADRDKETSSPINQATFLMTNMLPQAPDNNQGPWANMENDLRSIAGSANELYIVAGGAGTGGVGSNGPATTVANGHVTVPAQTWKVVLVLPKGENDTLRATCATRTIAVIMPNTQGIRGDAWQNYIVSVDAVEALTGYDFFSNLPDPVERCVEAGINGNNPALDTDADGVADTADNCVFDSNVDQTDTDHDGAGNACDADDDNDGTPDTQDAFPLDPSESVDTDHDGIGNNADPDDDNDGVADVNDAFPLDSNESADTDGDGIGNNADPDDDGDGQTDADETACGSDPLVATSKATDTDGDNSPDCVDADDDGDGVADTGDNCPLTANPDQANADGDAFGDVCDPDDDNDGVQDGADLCPGTPAGTQVNASGCADADGDGVADTADNCPLIPNADQTDTDHDGAGNSCDADDDNDGVADVNDAFPLDPNESVDTDHDGIGNNADPDDDNDGVADAQDAFPLNPNESADTDHDGVGNNADTDDDNDGVADVNDAFPLDPNESVDTDNDGIGNNADMDDDNDGVLDVADNCRLTFNPTQADFDNDGIGDTCDPVTGPPTTKEQCKNEDWGRFDSPRRFKNQGDCIQFVNTGK